MEIGYMVVNGFTTEIRFMHGLVSVGCMILCQSVFPNMLYRLAEFDLLV